MKRANGTGSIYKKSDDKRHRKPWVVVINMGMDPGEFCNCQAGTGRAGSV